MNYTSPSPANIAVNGNLTTWWIPATNLSSITATGVSVNVSVSPANGLQLETWSTDTGSFNSLTKIWNVGTLAPGQTKWLKIVTKVVDVGLAPFSMTSIISGNGIDPNNVNNTLVQTVTAVATTVTAGAVSDIGCACIDVSLNDTPCNYGVSEWRLNPSVINSTTYTWDEATGKGQFTHADPTLPITTSYSLWCDPGTGFVQISGPATITIPPIIEDKDTFDHTVLKQTWAELSVQDKAAIELLLPGVIWGDFCYVVTRNADGDITSAYYEPCDVAKDTRTFYLCTEELCDAAPDCECEENLPTDIVLPVDYNNPEIGDTIILRHPGATSVWVFNGDNWVRSSCGCLVDALPIDTIAFTGTNTKTLTITFSDGSVKTASFVDLQAGGGGGEANDGVNLGIGAEVFKEKAGVELRFRTLVAGSNVTINENADEVVINSSYINTDTNTTYSFEKLGDYLLVEPSVGVNTLVGPFTGCNPVTLEVVPQVSDVGNVYTLHIAGENNTHPDWNTWIWQTADKYSTGTTINPNPTWVNAQTGGTTYTQTADDKIIRVVWTAGNCTYYSSESGFEFPLSAGNGSDESIDFTIVRGTETTFATAGLFPTCSGTPTYSLQWYDPNAFSTISVNSSTGALTYDFYPYNWLSNNSIVVERNCGGVIDIIRLNYTIDYSLVQALNTYYEEGNRTPSSYNLTINNTTPQFLQFTSSTGNASMFTNISSNTLLRFDGIQGNTDVVGVIFEVHLSGNVSVPDDEDFTIRLVENGTPSTDKLMVNNWRSKHSFSKHYLITLNPTDTIGFDVTHSNVISPGNIVTTFSDVCILLKPIGQAQ